MRNAMNAEKFANTTSKAVRRTAYSVVMRACAVDVSVDVAVVVSDLGVDVTVGVSTVGADVTVGVSTTTGGRLTVGVGVGIGVGAGAGTTNSPDIDTVRKKVDAPTRLTQQQPSAT
jgi:hypothetical protein